MFMRSMLGLEERARKLESSELAGMPWLGGQESLTGIEVSETSSLAHEAVLCAVQLISGAAGALPLVTFRRRGRDRERATDHRVYRLLHDEPNPESSSITFRISQLICKLLWGNSYAEIEASSDGGIAALWHLPSAKVRPVRVFKHQSAGLTEYPLDATPEDRRRGGTLLYEVSGTVSGHPVYLHRDEVLHVPGPGFDGVMGYSPIRVAYETVALGLAVQQWSASTFGSDSTPGGLIKRPADAPPLSPKGVRNRIAAWEAQHKGVRRSGRIAVLQEGEAYESTRIPPAEAQMIEMAQFSISKIARIYNTPPHLLGDLSRATFSNIEHQGLEFVIYTLTPHLVALEQELCRKLFLERERGEYFVEHVVDGLLRGDMKTRYEGHRLAIEAGFQTPAGAARIENLDPVPPEQGGDTYRAPLNFMAAGDLGRSSEGKPGEDEPTPARSSRRELREQRAVEARFRMRSIFRPLVEGDLERVVGKETGALERELRRLTPAGLVGWAQGWYPETLQPFVERVAGRQLRAYLQAIAGEARQEIGVDLDLDDAFLAAYAVDFARRYTRAHMGALSALATSTADVTQGLKLLGDLTTAWKERAAAQEAAWEVVRADNAAALEVYKRAGFTRKVWVPNRGACRLCQSMAGRTAEIAQPFLQPGDQVRVDDPEVADLEVKRVILAAPLHDGCSCSVRAER